jgi:formate hydrogenlyase subunit 3/multisubunit Na+/H+ antiporter MnhD subunit
LVSDRLSSELGAGCLPGSLLRAAFLAVDRRGHRAWCVLFSAVLAVTPHWAGLFVDLAATILYGNLCAIPQRNFKRLLGYSVSVHAGYPLLGVVAMNAGVSAILYYLSGYLFTALAFMVGYCDAERAGRDISAWLGAQRFRCSRPPYVIDGVAGRHPLLA